MDVAATRERNLEDSCRRMSWSGEEIWGWAGLVYMRLVVLLLDRYLDDDTSV